MNRYITFIFIGAPGSGKGTQGEVLGTVPRFFHCARGEVFRSLELRTPLGQKIIDYSRKGLLVPDDLTVELWRTKIQAQVVEGEFNPILTTKPLGTRLNIGHILITYVSRWRPEVKEVSMCKKSNVPQ